MRCSGLSSWNVSFKTLPRKDFSSLYESILGLTSARNTLQTYWVTIVQVLLTRLQNSKTDTFALRFVRLYHFISAKADEGLGADFFIAVTDQVQNE
jgi:exportin-2 (importin alpha re-exporter)